MDDPFVFASILTKKSHTHVLKQMNTESDVTCCTKHNLMSIWTDIINSDVCAWNLGSKIIYIDDWLYDHKLLDIHDYNRLDFSTSAQLHGMARAFQLFIISGYLSSFFNRFVNSRIIRKKIGIHVRNWLTNPTNRLSFLLLQLSSLMAKYCLQRWCTPDIRWYRF